MDRHDISGETARISHRSWMTFAVLLTIAVAIGLVAFGRAYVHDMLPDTTVTSAAETEKPLRVIVARTAGGPAEWIAYQRVLALLSERLGRRFETRFVAKEDMAPQAVQEGADLAFVCAHTYIALDKKGVVKGIATAQIDGRSTTTQMLVVDARSPFKTFEDLKGARLGASDKSSLGGYAYLCLLAKQRKFVLEKYFSEVETGDTEEHYVSDVLAGKLDATVVSRSQISPSNLARLRIITRSAEVGLPAVVVNSSLDASLSARIREILLSEELRSKIGTGGLEGFVPLKPEDYMFAEELTNACTLKPHK